MPDVDGVEICRRIRSSHENERTAVMALTALPVESPDVDGMIRAGCDAVLIKPCLPELLLTEIRKLLRQGRMLRELGISQQERAIALRAHSDCLQRRAKENQQFAVELLRRTERLTLCQRVISAYIDMPGLSLTLLQATRLWNVDAPVCKQMLDTLAVQGFLVQTDHGQYRRFRA